MTIKKVVRFARVFFLGVPPGKDTHPLQDSISVVAMYTFCVAFLFTSAFNLPLMLKSSDIAEAITLAAYILLAVATLVVFFATRSLACARIPAGIAVIALIVQQFLDPGGVYGLGLLNFFFAIPIVYLFFGLYSGSFFIGTYYFATAVRLGQGKFRATSILANPEIPHRLVVILGLATAIGIITCACLERVIQSLYKLAFYDPVTGLPNRLRIEENLKKEIRFGKDRTFSVIGIRILNYNKINAMLGTDQGDNLMKQIGERLDAETGPESVTGRWSGSLFVSIQRTTGHAEIEDLARTALDALSEPYHLENHSTTVLFALSVSRYPQDALSSRQLMSNIISLLDGNRPGDVRFFSNENLRAQHYHFSVIERLSNMDPDREFSLAYQPKIRISDGECTGAEILLRWHDEKLGDVSPAVFIPLAEQSGQIRKITRWVIRNAFSDISEGRDDDSDPETNVFAINLSVMDLRDRDFVDFLDRELILSDCPAGLVEFEITEGTMVDDDPHIRTNIRAILDRGFRISIDDFGTGYSSLSYLHRLQVHALKIDQSFVKSLDPASAPVIDAIISMGKSLGLDVIAEGVESFDQLNYLRRKGCDTAQGWLFSKAISFGEYLEYRAKMREGEILEEIEPEESAATR
jgi:diguanylate cyclase (GGDEF)-like protein